MLLDFMCAFAVEARVGEETVVPMISALLLASAPPRIACRAFLLALSAASRASITALPPGWHACSDTYIHTQGHISPLLLSTLVRDNGVYGN